MPFALLKYGLKKDHADKHHFTPTQDLKKHYDVVIIGAGGHGTAIAYNLAKYYGITNVAVLDKGYLGGGNTARNTAVIRSNYLTEEGVSFYRESVKMFQNLSNEFGYNVMYENRGQLTLAHTDAAIRSFRWRAEVNQHLGVRSELVDTQTIRELVPNLH
ncbi:MAG: sarcosine oxidase subunit beta, partial [Candidatus Azotimanducaceae bacterium]